MKKQIYTYLILSAPHPAERPKKFGEDDDLRFSM